MESKKRPDLVDRAKIYELACAGCTRHGELPGECYHDEPCEKLIFAFTVAETVDAVEVPCLCKACTFSEQDRPADPMVCRKWSTKRGTVYTSPDGYCHKGKPKEVEGK